MAEAPPESSDDDEGGGEEEGNEAALSKRAAKKQRKREREAAEAIADAPITSGFGHAMLLKMGWGGNGTGLRDDGIAEPVKALPPSGKKGLAAEDDAPTTAAAAADGSKLLVPPPPPSQPIVPPPPPPLLPPPPPEGGSKAAKRARKDAGETKSLSWQAEIELSAAVDEQTVSELLFNLPNVLYVQKVRPGGDKR